MEFFTQIQDAFGSTGASWLWPTVFSFAAVFLLVFGMVDYLHRRTIIRRRRSIFERGLASPDTTMGQEWLETSRSLRFQSVSATSALLGDIEKGARQDENEASKIQRDLLLAGYFDPQSVVWYQAIRFSLLFVAGLSAYAVMANFYPETPSLYTLLAVAFGGISGFLLPSFYVRQRQKSLVQQCQDGFPDFIDLMVICAEAGISARAGLDKLSRELAHTQPYLGAHLYMANLQVRAGSTLHDAMMGLARRTRVDEAANLATLLQQTEQMGTSVTDALRVYSDEMRHRRLMKAEERAHSLPVKLVVPLGLYVFPVILIVILLPVIMRMQHMMFMKGGL